MSFRLALLTLFGALLPTLTHAQQVLDSETLGSFRSIELVGPLRVELIPSDENRLQLVLWDMKPENVRWTVENQTLRISASKIVGKKRAFAEVKLFYRAIDHIKSAGATLTCAGPIVASSLLVEAEISKNDLSLMVQTDELVLRASGGKNRIRATGISTYADYYARLGAVIECLGVTSRYAKASAAEKGEIQLGVVETLDSRATLGGSVFFQGDPELINIKRSTAGGVENVNPR